jgi:hypothetical protein
MFKSKTVFVVGAGASAEVNMPVGSVLTTQIADLVRINEQQGSHTTFVNSTFARDVREHLRQTEPGGRGLSRYEEASANIARNMPLAQSIDNYLHTHQEDPAITSVGKLAIARCVLEAERKSLLYTDISRGDLYVPFDKLKCSWFDRLGKILFSEVVHKEVSDVFKNISFICFNYDRCIETFLEHALWSYFSIRREEAQELVRNLRVIHPYGQVGFLPLHRKSTFVPFGAVDRILISDISQHIKTFTERLDEQTILLSMKGEIEAASTIVFLGFAYHRLNMGLLKAVIESDNMKTIFGTTKGFSNFDQNGIVDDLHRMVRSCNPYLWDCTCVDLFDSIGRSLPAL